MQKPPLANLLTTNKEFLTTTHHSAEKDAGVSFILKEKGLEKLDDKKVEKKDEEKEENEKQIEQPSLNLNKISF